MLFLLFSFFTANAAMTEIDAQKECESRKVYIYRPADTKKDTEFKSKKECEEFAKQNPPDAYSLLCRVHTKAGTPVIYKKWTAKVKSWPFGEQHETFETKELCDQAVKNGVPEVRQGNASSFPAIAAKSAGGKNMLQFISDCFEDEITLCD